MQTGLQRLIRSDTGATASEYALLVALIALVIVSTLTAISAGWIAMGGTVNGALGR